jgi:hypothetical protein
MFIFLRKKLPAGKLFPYNFVDGQGQRPIKTYSQTVGANVEVAEWWVDPIR